MAEAGVLVQMEFIGECSQDTISRLQRGLTAARLDLENANKELARRPKAKSKPKPKKG